MIPYTLSIIGPSYLAIANQNLGLLLSDQFLLAQNKWNLDNHRHRKFGSYVSQCLDWKPANSTNQQLFRRCRGILQKSGHVIIFKSQSYSISTISDARTTYDHRNNSIELNVVNQRSNSIRTTVNAQASDSLGKLWIRNQCIVLQYAYNKLQTNFFRKLCQLDSHQRWSYISSVSQ